MTQLPGTTLDRVRPRRSVPAVDSDHSHRGKNLNPGAGGLFTTTGLRGLVRSTKALHKLVVKMRTIRDSRIERRWNVDTITVPNLAPRRNVRFKDSVHYEAIWYPLLFKYLKPLDPGPDDVVYDIGCGMGRTLLALSRIGVKKCVGIEICPELVEQALVNARNLRGGKCPIEIREQDASQAEYSDGTIYLIINPFGEDTLRTTLESIKETLTSDPRHVQLAYCTPRHENTLHDCDWLKFAGRKRSPFHNMTVSYWVHENR